MKNTAIVIAILAITSPMQVLAQDNGINEAVAEAASDAMEAVEAALEDIEVSPDNRDPQLDEYIESRFVQVDYPTESYLAAEEGVVRVRLDVDATGNATGCQLTEPSEFERLNDATCPHILQRGTFRAGEDEEGKPVAGSMEESVYWRIREPEFQTFSMRFAFTQTETGETVDCELISFSGTVPKGMESENICMGASSESSLFRNEDGVPVSKRVEIRIGASVSDPIANEQGGE